MIRATVLILVVLACAGCKELLEPAGQKLSTETLYRRDMIVTINGVTEEGVIVVPLKPVNDFHVRARGPLNLFSMSTCHREWTKESAWNVSEVIRTGLFGWGSRKVEKKNEVTFQYIPAKGTPEEGAVDCLMELAGFDKEGRHSWALVDFQTPDMKLTGKLGCNGTSLAFTGVVACQARAGLIQQLEFSEPVILSPDVGCGLGDAKDGRFKFPMPRGMCIYHVEALADPARKARITLLGYDSILIREE